MINEINTSTCIPYTAKVPNISNIKPQFITIIFFPHIILFFFITTENTDLSNVSV